MRGFGLNAPFDGRALRGSPDQPYCCYAAAGSAAGQPSNLAAAVAAAASERESSTTPILNISISIIVCPLDQKHILHT